MKTVEPIQNRAGVTLLELLLVIFIIGILAAVFLPVIGRTKTRSKQVDCLSHLKQIGVAYHAFAHEHDSRFPFQVPIREGGTLELVQSAAGTIQTAYHHFRALSNELLTPKLLTCPADTKTPVDAFHNFRNENLSYFASVTADYSRPTEVLSGDRNIRVNGESSLSVMRFGPNVHIAWTGDLHQYDGNLLFSDAHVERLGSAELEKSLTQQPGVTVAVVPVDPSTKPSTGGNGNGGGGAGAGGGAGDPFASLRNVYGGSPGSSGGGSSSGYASAGSGAATPSGNSPSYTANGGLRTTRRYKPQGEDSLLVYPNGNTRESKTNAPRTLATLPPIDAPVSTPDAGTPAPGSFPSLNGAFVVTDKNWWWLLILVGITLLVSFAVITAVVYRRDRRRIRPMERKLTYGLLADRRRRGR